MSADPIRDVVTAREAAVPRADVGSEIVNDLDVLAAANGQLGDEHYIHLPPGQEGETTPTPSFLSGSDFLTTKLPSAVPLLGTEEDVFLPRGGWLNVYGQAGASKTTLALDLIAHMAAGIPWLEIHVPAPVRVAVIVNEGPPGLLQSKVAHKVNTWDGPPFIERVFFYVSPWGFFSFEYAAHRAALRAFCVENEIDLVYGDPLQLLGAPGGGTPQETALFRSWMFECGLARDLAFYTSHHENKSGQMSGAYEGHSDTTVHLEQFGDAGTRLTWRKVRHADTPNPRRWELAWDPECRGFHRLELASGSLSDAELESRLDTFLFEQPDENTTEIVEGLGVRGTRVRQLLNKGADETGRYLRSSGPSGAKLYRLAPGIVPGVPGRSDDRDDLLHWEEENPHE